MNEIEFIDVDDIWRILGRGGRYQVTQSIILFLAGSTMAFHVLSVVFIGSDVSHVCNNPGMGIYELSDKPENITHGSPPLTLGSCSIDVESNNTNASQMVDQSCTYGYNYTQSRDRSFVSEWDLVCASEPLGKLSQTLVMAGMMVGATVLPQLGDKYGRKKLQVSSFVMALIIGLAMAFNPNFIGFLILRFAIGVFQHGTVIPAIVHMLELFPADDRELIGFLANAPWAISIALLTLLGYICRNYTWRTMQIVMSAFYVFSFVEIWLLDESLRWLVANKKYNEVIRIVKKAARMNNKDFSKVWQLMRDKSETKRMMYVAQVGREAESAELLEGVTSSSDADEIGKRKKTFGYMDLLRNGTLRPYALIMCCAWMTNSLTYYGLALLSSKLAGNLYVNFFLGGALEIPSTILMVTLFKKIGRKKTLIFFHVLAGVCLLVAVLVSSLASGSPAAGICLTVFSLAGRFAISASFNGVWVYTPEIFPTNIRNIAVGLASSAARLGAMASPFFNSLATIAVWGPGAIFLGLIVLVTVMITFLPETTGRELPQTVEELKSWKNQRKQKRETEKEYTLKADEFQFEKI